MFFFWFIFLKVLRSDFDELTINNFHKNQIRSFLDRNCIRRLIFIIFYYMIRKMTHFNTIGIS